MSVLTAAWSMCAAVCFMIGLMHLMFGLGKGRTRRIYLLSSLMAVSAGFGALIDLNLLTTNELSQYRTLLTWQAYVLFFLLSSMVWFIYFYFGTARAWLCLCITVLWGGNVIVSVLSPDGGLFSELTDLRRMPTFWGEMFSVPVGVVNPWKYLMDVASLLIVVFITDASVRAWRNGDRRRARTVGASSVFFIVVAGTHTPLVDAGVVATPYMISFAFLAIVMAMSVDLVKDAVQTTRLAEELRAKEERWRRVLEKLDLAVVGIDAGGRIDYVNPFFERLSGYVSHELTGRRASEIIGGIGDPLAREDPGQTRNPASTGRITARTGAPRDLAWSTVSLRNADGSNAGVLGIGEDVTQRLRTQRELRDLEKEMEHLTRAGMLGELASGLAHELSQPLAAILSNAQAGIRLLRADPPDLDEVGEILSDIASDDKRAGEVIHELRAMLRKGEINREVISLRDVAAGVVDLLRGEFLAHATKLRFESRSGTALIEASRVEIQQVIMNLAINAMRAVADVPVTRREVIITTVSAGDEIELSVEDAGPGISSAQLPHVFEPFFTTRSAGLGMGLPICRRIVEAHGGRIWIGNRDGGGARVCVTLPLVKAELETGPAQGGQSG